MSGLHAYCRSCDAWYREAHGRACPDCGAALEARTFRYPEDVFGPSLPGEAPIARSDLRSRPRSKGHRGKGIGLLMLGHLILLAAGTALRDPVIFFIGVTQLIYAIPMMIIYGSLGENRTVSGLALGAGITFLLNAAGFGIVRGSY